MPTLLWFSSQTVPVVAELCWGEAGRHVSSSQLSLWGWGGRGLPLTSFLDTVRFPGWGWLRLSWLLSGATQTAVETALGTPFAVLAASPHSPLSGLAVVLTRACMPLFLSPPFRQEEELGCDSL